MTLFHMRCCFSNYLWSANWFVNFCDPPQSALCTVNPVYGNGTDKPEHASTREPINVRPELTIYSYIAELCIANKSKLCIQHFPFKCC